MLQKRYSLKAKPAFPVHVRNYKEDLQPPYVHQSESELLRDGNGSSAYWNPATLLFLRNNLDLQLESSLGYNFDQAFTNCT